MQLDAYTPSQTRTGKLTILDNRYSCDQCAHAVRRLHFLRGYMQTRTGKLAILDNRYSCDQCAHAVRRLHSLIGHMHTRTGKLAIFR